MNIRQKEYGWGCLDKISGKFIGVDQGSGGYPYIPDRSSQVQIFASNIEAQKYADMFNRSPSYGFKLEVKRIERYISILED